MGASDQVFIKVTSGSHVIGSSFEDRYGRDLLPSKFDLREDIYILEREVSGQLWDSVMGESHSAAFRNNSASMISWYDARAFCNRLNDSLAGTGYTARLPTEEEWEYSLREALAHDPLVDTKADYLCGYKHKQGSDVLANVYRDFRGGLSEWTLSKDVNLWDDAYKVVRGNSSQYPLDKFRPSARFVYRVSSKFTWVGFRVVLTKVIGTHDRDTRTGTN